MRATVLFAAAISLGCLWDYDTVKEESLGQSEIAAVIGGDLHKHSKAFYEGKLAYAKSPVDDRAVALAKLGKIDEAIALIDTTDAKRYETLANRGTFLAMKGDLAGAIDTLKKAIEVNPDAHFGREKFQIQLLEYMQKVAKDPKLPERENFLGISTGEKGNAGTAETIRNLSTRAKARAKLDPAVLAIAGLVRFGDGQTNPHLWYGLAWALVRQGDAQLATRAFRRAELLGHPRAQADGSIIATTIKSIDAGCCPEPGEPRAVKAWSAITPIADKEWAAGVAVDTKRQATEDKQVAAKQYKAVFGY